MIVVSSPFFFPSNFSERKRLEWKHRVQEEEQEEGEGEGDREEMRQGEG